MAPDCCQLKAGWPLHPLVARVSLAPRERGASLRRERGQRLVQHQTKMVRQIATLIAFTLWHHQQMPIAAAPVR